jgi:hypothetical protein
MVLPDSTDIKNRLRQAGLRVTVPRECALQWLAEHPHAIADQRFLLGKAEVVSGDTTSLARHWSKTTPDAKNKIPYHY